MFNARALAATILAIALPVTLVACGGDDDDSSAAKDQASAIAQQLGQDANSAQNASSGDSGKGTDLCKLLTDDEVSAVIGAHDDGTTGVQSGGYYADASCVWKATAPSTAPDGEPDAIEVSVLTGDIAKFAKEQDAQLGEPLASFGHDARFQQSYARLWFDCGDGKFCHVHVDTANEPTQSGDTRQEAAVKLGQKLLERV